MSIVGGGGDGVKIVVCGVWGVGGGLNVELWHLSLPRGLH